MKKSNILLLSLAIFTFITILASNLVLKAEYERFDFNDVFHGYGKTAIPSFSVVKIKGNYAGLVQVQASRDFEIRIHDVSRDDVEWELNGDTLELFYHRAGSAHHYSLDYAFKFSPAAFVMAPSLCAVYLEDCAGKISGFEQDNLITNQNGFKSGILMTNNVFKSVNSDVNGGGFLKIGGENQIRKAHVNVRDSSSFDLEKDIISSLSINADTNASVKIPGGFFIRMARDR